MKPASLRLRSDLDLLLLVVMAVVLATTLLASAIFAAGPHSGTSSSEQVLVAFKLGTPASAVAPARSAVGAKVVGRIPGIDVQIVAVPKGESAQGLANAYLKNPNVLFAEEDAVAKATLVPNDPIYWRQWAHPYVNSPVG